MRNTQHPKVVHLIDDTTAGGVMRVLDHLTRSTELAQDANHKVHTVKRGRISLRRLKADVIVSHLSISWRTLPALMALRARHSSTKLFHVEHSYTDGFVRHNVTNKRRFSTLLRTAFRLFDQVIAVSEGQGKWLKEEGYLDPSKMTVIRSYVDLEPFTALPSATSPVRHFGAIGRLDKQKGFDVLILAFQKVEGDDLRLSIFGQGPEESNLRALAKNDPRIIFEGFAESPTAPYQAVDAVLMPSRWEAYGLVAIEALAAGRALICSGVDGLQDHTEFGAQMVAVNDVEGWTAKIGEFAGQMIRPKPICIGSIRALDNRWGWKNALS